MPESLIAKARFAELGLPVGHWTHPAGNTGVTVLLCPGGAAASGEVRGAAPGTRETDLLRPGGLVGRVDAIVLCGGSAPGLAAADGVLQYLREQGQGYQVGEVRVPIVPAAVIFDSGAALGLAPGADEGRLAAASASADEDRRGRVGVGAGAMVGWAAGPISRSPGGFGHAAVRVGEIVVGAIVAVNPIGDVRDPATGVILAGSQMDGQLLSTLELLAGAALTPPPTPNTVIGAVATNIPLDQAALAHVARMANNGLAHTISPANTMFDGDTLFALSYPGPNPPQSALPLPVLVTLIGSLAAEAMARAVVDAVTSAT